MTLYDKVSWLLNHGSVTYHYVNHDGMQKYKARWESHNGVHIECISDSYEEFHDDLFDDVKKTLFELCYHDELFYGCV